MYLSTITIENFRCFGEGPQGFELPFSSGLTALVGENDAGKTAVIDALRFALGTTDQEWYRLEDTDFYGGDTSREIRIVCKFEGLGTSNMKTFIEYLSYGKKKDEAPILYVNWTAKDTDAMGGGRSYRQVDVTSGKDGKGPVITSEVRGLLRTTYLRPLRNAEQALASGRGSRLSQVLYHTDEIKTAGVEYDPNVVVDPKKTQRARHRRFRQCTSREAARDREHAQQDRQTSRWTFPARQWSQEQYQSQWCDGFP